MNSKSGIYKIVNLINNKIYVGSSINLTNRKYRHFSNLRNGKHYNIHLQRAFNTYGKDNFIFEVVEYVEDKTKLLEREQYWIDKLNVCNREIGYNILHIAGNSTGFKMPKEAIIKAKKSMLGKNLFIDDDGNFRRIVSEETKRKISSSCMGHFVSEKTKEKISVSNKGKRISADTKIKISNTLMGHKQSKETKIKKSLSDPRCKPVINIDTGEIFNSIRRAELHYHTRNIVNVCNGIRDTAKGYKWSYYNQEGVA